MKQILIFSLLFNFANFLMGQTEITFKTDHFVYGKNLKNLDKRFKKDKDCPNCRYIAIEIFNPTNDTLYFCEYSQNLSISNEELFFNDGKSPLVSAGNGYGCKLVNILPNQRKLFITGLIESKNKKLVKCIYTIDYFTKDIIDIKYSKSKTFEVDILGIKEYKLNTCN